MACERCLIAATMEAVRRDEQVSGKRQAEQHKLTKTWRQRLLQFQQRLSRNWCNPLVSQSCSRTILLEHEAVCCSISLFVENFSSDRQWDTQEQTISSQCSYRPWQA